VLGIIVLNCSQYQESVCSKKHKPYSDFMIVLGHLFSDANILPVQFGLYFRSFGSFLGDLLTISGHLFTHAEAQRGRFGLALLGLARLWIGLARLGFAWLGLDRIGLA
jgi:hypothetical protein